MSESTVIVLGSIPPSSNNMFPARGTRRFLSAEYKAWREASGFELIGQRPKSVKGLVELLFQFGLPRSGRRIDVSNRVKACEDLLVSHAVIEGDDQRFVRRIIAEWSEDLPGVIITITPLASGKPLGGRGAPLEQPGALR